MKTVLVVDDTKNIRTLLSTCLELNGYKVFTANNAQVALEILKSEQIDLAFIDIKMPETSGTELLKKMRTLNIDIPVVIMTAFATIKNAIDCTRLGAVAYLQKPFTADKVKTVLKELDFNEAAVKNDTASLINSSKELIVKGKYDDAYNMLKKALAKNPSCKEIYDLIGTIYENKNDLKQAEIFHNIAKQFQQ